MFHRQSQKSAVPRNAQRGLFANALIFQLLTLSILASAAAQASGLHELAPVKPCKMNLVMQNIGDLSTGSRFADINTREGWHRVATARGETNVFQSATRADVILRKLSVVDGLHDVQLAARMQIAASQLIQSDVTLSALVQLMPVVEIGRNFIITQKMSKVIAVEDLKSTSPDLELATIAIRQAKQRLSDLSEATYNGATSVLSASLEPSSKLVYWSPARAKLILPYLVKGEFKPNANMTTSIIQTLGDKRLLIGHRPRLDDLQKMAQGGVQVVVTILGANEDAQQIGERVRNAGMKWVWLNLGSAKTFALVEQENEIRDFLLKTLMPMFSQSADATNIVYLHCSAGIHRTGMITYGLLRAMGFGKKEALQKLTDLRPISAKEVGLERRKFIDSLFQDTAQ